MFQPKIKISAQKELYFLLILGQCIGLLPVTGIRGNNYGTVKFSWTSNRFIWSCFYLILQFINLIFTLIWQVKSEFFEVIGEY